MPENDAGWAAMYPWAINSVWFENVDAMILEQTTTLFYGQFVRFAPMCILVVGLDITGVDGSANTPKISIGNNAPNFDNVLPNTQLVGLTRTEDCWTYILPAKSIMPDPDTNLTLRVRQAAHATTYLFRCLLLGLDTW